MRKRNTIQEDELIEALNKATTKLGKVVAAIAIIIIAMQLLRALNIIHF